MRERSALSVLLNDPVSCDQVADQTPRLGNVHLARIPEDVSNAGLSAEVRIVATTDLESYPVEPEHRRTVGWAGKADLVEDLDRADVSFGQAVLVVAQERDEVMRFGHGYLSVPGAGRPQPGCHSLWRARRSSWRLN